MAAGAQTLAAAKSGASVGLTAVSATALSGLASAGIGLAVAGVSLVMGLLAAHDARVKAAKEENAALAQAVVAFDADLHTIFDAANKGDIEPGVAANACMDVRNWYWIFIQPLQQGPTKGPTQTFPNPGAPNNAAQGGIYYEATDGAACHCAGQAACTAGCCFGCANLDPCLSNAYIWFSRGKAFTLSVPPVAADKYGLPARAAYTLTFTPPKVEQPEAEVTINKTSGIITVGAPPSASDVVIASGVTAIGAAPDTGADVIQHTASGADVNTSSAVSNELASIPGGIYTVIIGAILLLFLTMMPRKEMA